MLKRSKSHYSVSPTYKLSGETNEQAKERRKAQAAALKSLGWSTVYYEFPDGDLKRKAQAKAQAERTAAHRAEKTGFTFDVTEGFFLSF